MEIGIGQKIRRWLRRQRAAPELSPSEGYARWAATYGRQPNALQRLEARSLECLLPPLEGRTVLDLGCGWGRVAKLANKGGAATTIAVDFSYAMLRAAAAQIGERSRRVEAAAHSLPFKDESFDVVICALMMGHSADLARPLTAMARILRPRGHLLISDFHPLATLRGWQRTFVDDSSGRTFAIRQHPHLLSEYVTLLSAQGLLVEALEEPLWEGFPVAFVLRAHKAARPPTL